LVSMNSTVGLLSAEIKTKREFLPEVIVLLSDMLRRPRLDSGELEIVRRQIVTNLQQSLVEPQPLAINHVRRALAPYNKNDVRYVRTLEEDIAMYQDVSVDQVRALHQDFLSSQAGEVSVVGDFDADEVKALLKTQLEGWETSQPYVRVRREPHPEVAGSTTPIETPDKANAFLFAQQQYRLSDDSDEYASLVLGNFILGGGSLSSRLGDRVRQTEGLSYSVASRVSGRAKDDRVDFMLYAITNPQNKDILIEVIREEIDLLRDQGITEDELQRAKKSYLDSARVRRANDRNLANELVGTIFNKRTMQFHADHEQRIRAATVESVNEAIRKYIVPEKLVMAVGGDFASVTTEE
ncbi:MAG: insulinase family protein, partial [Pirellulales bacterium]|nr:insulinase family protein [Pirellulales bacterium]